MPATQTFPASHRLRTPARFAAVYDAQTRTTRGPLVFHALPNNLKHHRIGLSVSRRVGTAPRRNRIKRLLREAYRLDRHLLPGAYDIIVVVRPHEPLELPAYRAILREALTRLAKIWQNRIGDTADSGN